MRVGQAEDRLRGIAGTEQVSGRKSECVSVPVSVTVRLE